MNVEQARDILSHIVAQRVRWGKQYDAGDIGLDKVTDALVALAHEDSDETLELRKSLAKANRQVGAANARETKLKNKVKELEDETNALHTALARIERVSHTGGTEGSTED
jgi:septal ring factor EnvC (AmiA/AmiB activator)